MNGLLAVWNDCDPQVLERYEHWYMSEHLPDRVGLPGVRNGVRHEAAVQDPGKTSPRFFTSYDLDDVQVLNAPAYQQMLRNPTELTQAIMPHFLNMWRFVGRLLAHHGQSSGVWTLTLRLGQLQGDPVTRRVDLNAWRNLLQAHPPAQACRWRLYESSLVDTSPDAGLQPAAAPSPEARFRPGTDAVAHGVLLIEHLRAADLKHSVEHWLQQAEVRQLLHPQDRTDQFLEMARLVY